MIGLFQQSLDPNAVAVGESTMPRYAAIGTTSAVGTGTLALTFFTATKSETISQLRLCTGTTPAAATPTLCRAGVYSVAGSGDLTLVASIPNDTTLFAAAFTVYTRTLTASFTKVAGQRYALGIIVVSATTTPTFYGNSGPQIGSFGLPAAPRLSGRQTGLSDLPASVLAASLSDAQAPLYSLLLP